MKYWSGKCEKKHTSDSIIYEALQKGGLSLF